MALMASEGRILKANFQKKMSEGNSPYHLYETGTHPQRGASTAVLGPRPSCPLTSYGAPFVPKKEHIPGATTAISNCSATVSGLCDVVPGA